MTVDPNSTYPLGAEFGSITLPPTQPIDMITLLASEPPTPDAHEVPPPVAASAHTNLASGDSPIAEWLSTVAPHADDQRSQRRHRSDQ